MANTISKEILVKDSAANPSGKPPPRDETLGLDPEIRFYAIYDTDETEEGEGSEILFIHNSNLAVSKQNLVKRNFPYINTFDHEGPALVSAMRDLIFWVIENLEITSPMDVNQGVAYMQRILRWDGI